jgi:hypothetical protein
MRERGRRHVDVDWRHRKAARERSKNPKNDIKKRHKKISEAADVFNLIISIKFDE